MGAWVNYHNTNSSSEMVSQSQGAVGEVDRSARWLWFKAPEKEGSIKIWVSQRGLYEDMVSIMVVQLCFFVSLSLCLSHNDYDVSW